MQLRDYQRDAIDSIYSYFADNSGNPLVIAPTGAGKSVIIAKFCEEVIKAWPGQRILMLTHVKELIAQNFARLKQTWPDAPAGIYSAAIGRRDTREPVLFCSIQSVHKRAYQIGRFDLVLVDESHLIPPDGEGMYNRLLADLKKINPALKVIGFSATPWRMKSGHLIGEDTLFTHVAYDKADIRFLIEQGHLCKVIPKRMTHTIDTDGVSIRGGEFVQRDLQTVADIEGLNQAVVTEMLEHAHGRKSWLVFCVGVDHAMHIRDILVSRGISAACVTGDTPKMERDAIIRDYVSGKIQALTNCDVLTTGFDAPQTDLLAVLRPTKSPGLWVQIVGRGMRTATGKNDCLVLDFAGNTYRHGPIDKISMKSRRKSDAIPVPPPVRTCPECKTILSVSVRECPQCQYLFPVEQAVKFDANASDRALLSFDESAIVDQTVTRIGFSRHTKPGKPDSLKVTYFSGLIAIAIQWVCLEHSGRARINAVRWWQIWMDTPAVKTVTDALQQTGVVRNIDPPIIVRVNIAGKFPEVVGRVAC